VDDKRSNKYYIYYAFFVLFKRKWTILLVTLFFFLLIFAYSFLTTPVWQGTAKVLVDYHPKQQLVFFPDVSSPVTTKPEANPVNDIVTILTSQQLTKEIVLKFHRDEMLRQSRENPQTLAEKVKKFLRDILIEVPKNILADLGIIKLKPENYLYDAIDDFMDSMQDIEVEEDTNVIDIAIYGETPQLATAMANEMAALVVDKLKNLNQQSAGEAYTFAVQQIELARANLHQAEGNLEKFRKDKGLVELSQQVELNLNRLDALTAEYQKSVSDQKAVAGQLAEVRSRIDQSQQKLLDSGSIIDNPRIVSLRSELDKLQMDLASMLTYKKENHPDVIRLRAGIQEAEEQLKEMTKFIVESQAVPINDYFENLLNQLVEILLHDAQLTASVEMLQKQIADNKKEGLRLLEQQLDEKRLLREVQIEEGIYEGLKNKMLEFETLLKVPFGNFNLNVVDYAFVFEDQDPDWPLWVLNLFIGLTGGLFLGIATAFVLEYLSEGCRTVEDTEQVTGIPVISVIDRFGKGKQLIEENGFLERVRTTGET
jgi:uncharacterized protein involved in exopolysaccharide biosynthesis